MVIIIFIFWACKSSIVGNAYSLNLTRAWLLHSESELCCTLQVPGNLIISARSGAHSFDATQMNMSHVISHLSFGMKVSPRVMSDVKRLIPYIGRSHDRLNGRSFINHRDIGANVTVSLSLACGPSYFINLNFFYNAFCLLCHKNFNQHDIC